MNVGEKIKNTRKALGISQQQLGGKEFTKGYISQIEKGRVNPSMNVLTTISAKLLLNIGSGYSNIGMHITILNC